MIYHHNINPIAFTIFSKIEIYWYGILYAVGILLAISLLKLLDSARIGGHRVFNKKTIDTFALYIITGVVLGSRLLYVACYKPDWFLHDFTRIFKIHLGGLSFHGGVLGVCVAIYLFIRNHANQLFMNYYSDGYFENCSLKSSNLSIADYLSYNRKLLRYIETLGEHGAKLNIASSIQSKMSVIWLYILDLIASVAPVGIFFGRIGNFINKELFGRPTQGDFGVVFSNGDVPRYPSQLYEALLEGLTLFIVINGLRFGLPKIHTWLKVRFGIVLTIKNGLLLGVFCALYGCFRIFIEMYREPDAHIGFLFEYLTLGQLLTVPMIPLGLFFIYRSVSLNRVA